MSETIVTPPARVLLLDSDIEFVERVADHLTTRRVARVFVSTHAESALETHLRTPCDVLIAEDEPDGVEFATLATRFRLMGQPRIVAMCSALDPQRVVELLRLRVNDVLVRPLDVKDVERSVRRELVQRRRGVMSRRRTRLLRAELRRARLRGRALEQRVEVLSRDVVTAYQRLAARLSG